jgi:hypothetical protein
VKKKRKAKQRLEDLMRFHREDKRGGLNQTMTDLVLERITHLGLNRNRNLGRKSAEMGR